jgi:N-acetylgalactosamine kinase
MSPGLSEYVAPVCVILAAGRGTRMRSKQTHKVCFPIAGRPAILRAMDAYQAAGISRFVVVVGAMAGQIVEVVGQEYPEASFVYQPEQRGTGHATRVGITPLRDIGYEGPIFVTMGDKLVEAEAIREFLTAFGGSDQLAMVGVVPRQPGSEGGRILLRSEGQLAGIVETRDIQKASILEKAYMLMHSGAEQTAAALEELAQTAEATIPDDTKRKLALGPLADALDMRDMAAVEEIMQGLEPNVRFVSVGRTRFAPAQAAEAKYQNAALYLFQAPALYESLRWISADNAQKEEYLTDAVNYLANATDAGQVGYHVLNADDVLTYNNPEELLLVEEQFRRRHSQRSPERLAAGSFRSVEGWLNLFDRGGHALQAALADIYGNDSELIQERVQTYRHVLEHFGKLYGFDKKVVLVRAPGRVNMMGRHIEHRGGSVNVMAINKEVILVAAPRADDTVRVANTADEAFPAQEFRIGLEIADMPWDDWLSYLSQERVQQLVRDSHGHWVNYVKAAFLRLQFQCRDRRITGMDAVFSGNIPVAAGLSSSSAVVVASAEAAAALNDLDLAPQDFVDLCGEGEWYVGTRGGAGDHAAMKFGQRGQLTQIGFFPFQVKGSVSFPAEYQLIVANSHVKAQKTTNARDTFNQRVAAYEFGLMLLKKLFPLHAAKMKRLRDVNPTTLQVRPSAIYEMIMALPETLSPAEVRERLGDTHAAELDRIMQSHGAPEHYLIRSVVLYGVAECVRAEMCRQLLEEGDVHALGRLMQISHDGDRVVRYTDEGGRWQAHPYDYMAGTGYLKSLMADLRSEDVERVIRAQLYRQPGDYACSTPEIDEMVDLSLQVPSVVGAQLSGAGLGGCIMVLVHQDGVDSLHRLLEERFYEPKGLEPALTVSAPVKGSGLITIAP